MLHTRIQTHLMGKRPTCLAYLKATLVPVGGVKRRNQDAFVIRFGKRDFVRGREQAYQVQRVGPFHLSQLKHVYFQFLPLAIIINIYGEPCIGSASGHIACILLKSSQ